MEGEHLMKLSVAEIAYDVCSDHEIQDEALVETFFTYIFNIVMKMKLYVGPELNHRIDHLLNGLNWPNGSNLKVIENLKRSVGEIISIDNEIIQLNQKKKAIHDTILTYSGQSVSEFSSLLKERVLPQGDQQIENGNELISQIETMHPEAAVTEENIGPSRCSVSGSSSFAHNTISKSLVQLNKRIKLEKTIDHNSSCDNMTQNDGENAPTEVLYAHRSEISNVLEDSFFSNRVSFEINGANVSCLTMYKKKCLVGTYDGYILKYLRNGKISNKYSAHKGKVSSIIFWKPRILSTSFDGTVNVLDVKFNFVRKLEIGEPITCSRELKGVLYLGTKNGYLIMYNIRALTRMGDSIQLAKTEVTDFEIITVSGRIVVAVCCQFGPVAIRDINTGALLLNLKHLLTRSCLASLKNKPSYLCGVDRGSFSLVELDNGIETLIAKKYPEHGGSHIIEKNGLFYCGGFDGHIYVYNELGMIKKKFFGTGEPLRAMAVGEKRIVFATASTITSIPLDE